MNFYLIFPISRRSIRLILLLSYHILSYVSYMFSYIILFIYLSIFSTLCTLLVHILFVYYTLYFLYTVFIYCSCTIFICLYSCFVHVLFSSSYIYVLFISYTVFLLYFSYDSHILYFSSYTIILYFPIFSSCFYNCLYFHRIAVLCFSYNVFYTCHFLLGFMSAYTLEVDMGITICTRRYYHCTRQ